MVVRSACIKIIQYVHICNITLLNLFICILLCEGKFFSHFNRVSTGQRRLGAIIVCILLLMYQLSSSQWPNSMGNWVPSMATQALRPCPTTVVCGNRHTCLQNRVDSNSPQIHAQFFIFIHYLLFLLQWPSLMKYRNLIIIVVWKMMMT